MPKSLLNNTLPSFKKKNCPKMPFGIVTVANMALKSSGLVENSSSVFIHNSTLSYTFTICQTPNSVDAISTSSFMILTS